MKQNVKSHLGYMPQSSGILVLDIHGMNKFQAQTLIDSRLKNAGKSVYRIRIIHGYHSGTELKTMIKKIYGGNNSKVLRIEYGLNPGETDLVLREFL